MITTNAGRVAFVLKGDYSNNTSYTILDLVTYNGKSYACKQPATGILPTNTAYWQLMSDPDVDIELKTMPEASSDLANSVRIYVGQTTSTYTSGQSYQCVEDPDNAGNYIWKPTVPGNIITSDSFKSGNSDNETHDANEMTTNGVYYYTSNGPDSSVGATSTDGAMFVQAYNDTWVAQIAQDYRTGKAFFRGRNDGTWTAWQAFKTQADVDSAYSSGRTQGQADVKADPNSYGLYSETQYNAHDIAHKYKVEVFDWSGPTEDMPLAPCKAHIAVSVYESGQPPVEYYTTIKEGTYSSPMGTYVETTFTH
jgi:hypothetical protein